MKVKVVIKVPMHCQKCHSKALQTVFGVPGVDSASLKGDDKNQIEVTGEGVDPIELATSLKKKFKHADLVTVGPAGEGEKKEAKKDEPKVQMQPVVWPNCQGGVPCYDYPLVSYDPYYQSSNCSIM